MIGVVVPISGVGLIVLLIGAVIAAIADSSTNSIGSDEACYREFYATLGPLTEVEFDTAVRNGSYQRWVEDLICRYGANRVQRVSARIEQETA